MRYTSPWSALDRTGSCTPLLTHRSHRVYEEELHSAIEARSESLQTLRELGPPDLVHLIKQPIKSATKQVRAPATCHTSPRPGGYTHGGLGILLNYVLGWSLPPCHRNRRILLCKLGCLYQYPHVLPPRQATQSGLRSILVRTISSLLLFR